MITAYQAKYFAYDLTRRNSNNDVGRLSQSLFDASVDLNPHQIEAALFALRSPLSKGVLLADEVGLGKTIEAGIVLCQYWSERRRRLLVICPASLRKQWALELEEKFNLPAFVLDAKTSRELQRNSQSPLNQNCILILSYNYANKIRDQLKTIAWDLAVIDEAHKLRNAYRESNKIGQGLKWALEDCRKLLLTATPLQNSLLELYGLSTLIDEHLFGDVDAFRSQYINAGGDLDGLRQRLAVFCRRTLRNQVTEYIRYTERRATTFPFRPSDDEHKLYEAVSAFLLRETSYAIPKRQRHLTELILRKLLASSSLAIAGTLETMKVRLEALRDEKNQDALEFTELLISEEDIEDDLLDEILELDGLEQTAPEATPSLDHKLLNSEIAELDRLANWANSIGTDTKTKTLLNALEIGFQQMANTGAQRKALIFTESRRTQNYLKNFLEANGYSDQIVEFSGTNNSPQTTAIYEKWLIENQGTGRIAGSRDIDIRTALIEYFRDHASILIATEAAAEGVNIQFCSLLINYDLPWNPQRVEQRIGRCHRYGQQHDVVVINFLNERNDADRRVLQLLTEKFNLFNGVFGASDEVLGSIESGVDFEKRILSIYQQCRTPAEIEAAFKALQTEMDERIQARMTDTRKMLLENFDEDVHERLKIQLHNAQVQLDKFSTYAIPYAGEEVVLHWANKDQYYTKSGENFSNYGFKLDDGRSVYFRLVAADTAKDNRKDNDKERRFVLIEADSRTVSDEDGEEYQQPLEPISEENGDLVLRFEYKAMPKGSKQDDLIAQALKNIFDHPVVKARWLGLTQRQPTEKNPQRSLLEKALNHYTAKNSTDYFMNKDLGGFLRRELDFYIKNEVMNLDDLQQAEKFADIEHKLRMIQTLRAIGLDVITFLAQLEDFQKKLWLKKKFIVAADYCITLDRIIKEAPALLDSIAANPKQWAQWQGLGLLHDKTDLLNLAEAGSVDYLKENPYLMVDSALFDAAFKQGLLAAIHDLDDSLDGLLVHGDNFQALHILQTRYSEKVSMSYIDPPYNTGLGDFSYKDKYLHSSWMSLIDQTTLVAHKLMSDKSVFWITLDDNEFHRAKLEIEQTSNLSFVSTVCWQKVYSPRMDAKQFSNSVDYLLAFSKSDNWIPKRMTIEPDLKQFALVDHNGRRYRSDPLRKWGKNSLRQDRPNLWYGIASPSGEVIFPIKPDGTEGYWRWKKEKVDSQYNELDWLDKGNGLQPYLRQYADNSTERPIETFWSFELAGSTHESSEEIKALFGDMAFPTPKPTKLIKLCIAPVDNKENIIIDYFAGSGTTGHAVISQNRNDNGNRFYILLEQGDYFDTVLKPRIQKVVYSADWKDGKATAPHTGISHAFKVLKIESYEDTLNNLALRRTPQQSSLLENLPESVQEDYLLRYLLEIESRGSLLSVEQFAKPFAVKLKVSVDSAGAYEERNVDLVETFNYLLGLHVKHIDMNLDKGFVLVTGLLPSGEKTLILWRDVEQVDYVALNRLCDKLAINPADSEYEVVYINGDHNIPAVFTSLENEGGITKVLKIRQIEPEFLSRMFDVETV